MADRLTPEQRSKCMARIRSKDTKPEKAVRSLLHSMGYRFRLHRRDLPGTPDITFTSRKKVVFVHGCFWHQHARCQPLKKKRAEYWTRKFSRNRERDQKAKRKLRSSGWQVLTIWECEVRDLVAVELRLRRFLGE